MKILVIGGTGLIGSSVVDLLKNKNPDDEIIAVYFLLPYIQRHLNLKYFA